MGRLVQGCILSAAVVCSTFPTEAQTGDGSLRDYVRDAQGGVLPGVTVTAHSTALLTPVYVERRFVSSLEVQTTAARDRDIAVYIQDNWKRHPRLTINAGVRADFVRRFDDITPLQKMMPPASYTIRLNAGGKQLTEKLELRKDPNSGGSEAEIAEQMKMLTALKRDIDAAADVVNQIELVRGQIASLRQVLEDAEIMQPAAALEQQLIGIEANLIELRLTGRGQDGVRWGSRLLGKFGYLAGGLAGTDCRPTTQQIEVQKVLEERLRKHQADLDAVLSSDLKALNELMRGRGVANIVTRRPTS